MLRIKNPSSPELVVAWPSQRRLSPWIRRCAGLIAGLVLLVLIHRAYLADAPFAFFALLAVVLGVAAVAIRGEREQVARIGWMAWQRCALAALMLAIVECGYRFNDRWSHAESPSAAATSDQQFHAVTFAEAQGDPHAFQEWWKLYFAEWNRHANLIQTFTPGGPTPYVFKPNTSRPFLHGAISVNSLGLCDREVPRDKQDKFRIVVMGSSHTQCPPIEAGDTPWPAKLEVILRERSPIGREIEVLNAGAAAYTIEHNLHRLKEVVLPLKPDMIITYFGYNEFDLFRDDFPLPKLPPHPRPKASRLLGKIDARFADWLAKFTPSPPRIDDYRPFESRLEVCRIAKAYREFIAIARREGIQLVVCNFNMAVDDESPDEAIRFYEPAFPNVRYMIEANRLNDALLKLLITPNTGARLIDVQAGLDGHYDREFIDLVHLSETGKQRLAENVSAAIQDLLPSQNPSRSRNLPPVAERETGKQL